MRKPLNWSIYIYIYGPYKPNTSLEYIYMGSIYMFSAFILMLICTLSLAYMCLCMLQAVILHHFGLEPNSSICCEV